MQGKKDFFNITFAMKNEKKSENIIPTKFARLDDSTA